MKKSASHVVIPKNKGNTDSN